MSRKKRNQKWLREKEYRKLNDQKDRLRRLIYRPIKVELDQPIHHGYYVEFILKEDVFQKQDEAFKMLLRNFETSKLNIFSWSPNKNCEVKNYKGEIIKVEPHFSTIRKSEFMVKFLEFDVFYDISIRFDRFSNRHTPYMVPDYRVINKYFRIKRSKAYITHKFHDDPEIKSQYELLSNTIINKYYNYDCSTYGSGFEKKFNNKKFRRQIKETIRYYITSGVDNDLIYKKTRDRFL